MFIIILSIILNARIHHTRIYLDVQNFYISKQTTHTFCISVLILDHKYSGVLLLFFRIHTIIIPFCSSKLFTLSSFTYTDQWVTAIYTLLTIIHVEQHYLRSYIIHRRFNENCYSLMKENISSHTNLLLQRILFFKNEIQSNERFLRTKFFTTEQGLQAEEVLSTFQLVSTFLRRWFICWFEQLDWFFFRWSGRWNIF